MAPTYHTDLLVARLSPGGAVSGVVTGGGPALEKCDSLAADSGGLFVAGSLTGLARFGGSTVPVGGLENTFVARLGPTLSWDWAEGAESNTWSRSGELGPAPGGGVYLAGTFGKAVTVGKTTLTGSGQSHGFLARFDGKGRALWARPLLSSKKVELPSMATDSAGHAVLAGTYQGDLTLGSFKLTGGSVGANTFDNLFVARVGADGTPRWLLGQPPSTISFARGLLARAAAGGLHLLAHCTTAPYTLAGVVICRQKGDVVARLTSAGKVTGATALGARHPGLMSVDAHNGIYLAQEEFLAGGLTLFKLAP